MKKIKIFLIIFLAFLLCFSFARPAQAMFGIFDFFNTALEGVEEKSAPVAKQIVMFFFTGILGVALLSISAIFLQWILSNPQWLTLENEVVRSGLYFTTGLVNLFIILLFVAIAIAWILKIETFAAKKALPKLIIVALLVNFAKVFVAIPIDIATILHRTILSALPDNFVFVILQALFGSIWQMIFGLGMWIASLTAIFMIPFVAPFAQYALVILVVASLPIFGPIYLSWLVQTLLAFMFSMTLFTLAFIFACRIFVIWFLAILAPLAFLCMVLPQTEKHWKEWLHHLFSWVFFGLLVLLFIGIGAIGAQHLRPQGAIPELGPLVPGLAWLSISELFAYYFFLFVYISIVSWLSKKAAPELADTLISQGSFLGGQITRGLKPVAGAVRRAAARQAGEQEEREKEWREKAEEAKKTGKLPPLKPLGLRVRGALTKPISWGYRLAGTTPGEEVRRELGRAEGEGEKIRDPDLLASKVKWAIDTGNLERAIGYLAKAIEKGGEFKKAAEKAVKLEDAQRLTKQANIIGTKPEAERIASSFFSKATPPEDQLRGLSLKDRRKKITEYREKWLKEAGFKSYDELTKEDKEEWDAKKYRTITQKIIGDMKPADIKNLGKDFWNLEKNPDIMAAIQRFWGGPQIGEAAREFGRRFVVDYMREVEDRLNAIKKLPPDQAEREYKAYIYVNPARARYLESTAAQTMGLTSLYALAPDEVKKKYPNMRAILQEKP